MRSANAYAQISVKKSTNQNETEEKRKGWKRENLETKKKMHFAVHNHVKEKEKKKGWEKEEEKTKRTEPHPRCLVT